MLNADASLAAKRTGQQLSIMFEGEWTVAVLAELRAWLAARAAAGHRTFVFEEFRHDAHAQPNSHKSWGSLPALACREGLIAPMNHPDGSPVMRRAESVKTHSHPVRLWAIASSFASQSSSGTKNASRQHDAAPEAVVSHLADASVGASRHIHSTASLLAAVTAYHQQREAR